MKVINGDLLKLAKQGKFDIIIHGCNCFCQMGAGIAKQIKKEFPEAYIEDCKTIKGDKGKLGFFSSCSINNNYKFIIVNAYTQYHYRHSTKANVDYDALRKIFAALKLIVESSTRIGYPLIGAGLAGGNWKKISNIIDQELEGCDHTLVKYLM